MDFIPPQVVVPPCALAERCAPELPPCCHLSPTFDCDDPTARPLVNIPFTPVVLLLVVCLQAGARVVLLEAQSRAGGRLQRKLTGRGPHKAWVDLGGQWAGVTQYKLLGLVKEFGLKVSGWVIWPQG
jgi:hypothetical protein